MTMIINHSEEFRRLQCSECAVVYYFPERWCKCAANEKKGWECPNGHRQAFRDSELDRTRRERDLLKQQAARLEEEASLARVRAEKAEKATKRLKKRSSAGTCPCCNRTFGNMAEHMKHQHPEFVADGGAKVVPIKRAHANQ
jgi:hypothetical protein